MDDMLPEGLQPKGDYKCPSCCPYDVVGEEQHGQVRGRYLDIMQDKEALDHLMYRAPATSSRVASRTAYYTYDSRSGHVLTKDGRIVPTPEQRQGLVNIAHVRLGHRGARAVADALRLHFHWKGMRDDVRAVIAACQQCAVKGTKPLIDKHLHSIPAEPLFEKWTIDLIGPLERDTATGNRYILTAVESWSRWLEVAGIPNKQSDTVALALKGHIFYRYGPPKQLACDNGGEFMGAVTQLCSEFGTKMIRGAPYHPMSQGAIERANRTLQDALFSLVGPANKDKWMNYLDQSVYTTRVLTHSFTGYAPYFILFGRRPPSVVPIGPTSQPPLPQAGSAASAEGSGVVTRRTVTSAATVTAIAGAGSVPTASSAAVRTATEVNVSDLELDMARRQHDQSSAQPDIEERQAKAQKRNQRDYAARVAASGADTGLPKSGTLVHVKLTGRVRKGNPKTVGPFEYVGPAPTAGHSMLKDGDGELFTERTNNIIVPPTSE
jgi:transposase InsO family protein